ncbi:MAG: HYR domain-containing protein [Lewinellaceae bacterium]|nr:HYR domain-containing protein [Lewinellaceae bacterium]
MVAPLNLSPGTYIVTVSDANACSKTTSFSIVATDNETPQIACPDEIQVCGSGVVDYPKATAQDNCGLSELPTVVSGPPSGSVMQEGVTVIIYQASDASGNSATCSFSIVVYESIQILVDSIANDMNGEGVGLISITPIGGGGYSFSWSKDGLPYTTTEDLLGLGVGVYSLLLLDSNGCTAALPPIVISNSVGTFEQIQDGWIRLKPNPAHSVIQLEIIDLTIISASILDMRGDLISIIPPSDLSSAIDIRHLPSAVYYLKLMTNKGHVWSLKFVKMGN